MAGRTQKKPWQNQEFLEELKVMVRTEVTSQLTPIQAAMEAVSRQNIAQSQLLEKFDAWRKELFGNGSGREGFLEKARAEDKKRMDSMEDTFSAMKNQVETERQVQIAVQKALTEKAAADHALSNTRIAKWQLWAAVAAVLAALGAGGWIANLIEVARHVPK